MTSFKCRECGSHWAEGPTRDIQFDQLCRGCLIHKLRVCQADATRATEAGTPEAAQAALATILMTTQDAIGPFPGPE